MPADTIGRLRGGLRSRSGGKGRSASRPGPAPCASPSSGTPAASTATEPRRRASFARARRRCHPPQRVHGLERRPVRPPRRVGSPPPGDLQPGAGPLRRVGDRRLDAGVVTDHGHRAVPPHRLLLLRRPRPTGPAGLPRRLQRLRRRHHAGRGRPAGHARARRARRRRHVVVQPGRPPRHRPRPPRRPVRRRPAGDVCRPPSRRGRARRHQRPRHPDVRGRVVARRRRARGDRPRVRRPPRRDGSPSRGR